MKRDLDNNDEDAVAMTLRLKSWACDFVAISTITTVLIVMSTLVLLLLLVEIMIVTRMMIIIMTIITALVKDMFPIILIY